jgi:hypothetical protein
MIQASIFGSFIDYDDSQLELVSMTAAYPSPWVDSGDINLEDNPNWWTKEGWYEESCYVPPSYFEEGSDLLWLELSSPSAPPMHMPGDPAFHCLLH